MTKSVNGQKTITPKARLSYPFLFSPDNGDMGGGKFSASFWVEKKPENIAWLKALKLDCAKVAREAFGTADVKLPLKDGDKKDAEASKGCIILTAKSKYRPGVVGADPKVSLTEADVYPGCYVRASITPYSYDAKGNKGVSLYLGNVQKLADGEALSGGGSSADQDFEPLAEASESESFDDVDDDLGL
jgi:hypothetical protein